MSIASGLSGSPVLYAPGVAELTVILERHYEHFGQMHDTMSTEAEESAGLRYWYAIYLDGCPMPLAWRWIDGDWLKAGAA